MAQHYPIKDFFRQTPNALLARYFKTKGLFSKLDIAAMKEGKPDELFAAWLALPDKQRNAMDAEFREIFEMSCEEGFRAINDEAEFQLDDEEFTAFVEKLSALPSLFERAIIIFRDSNSWEYNAGLGGYFTIARPSIEASRFVRKSRQLHFNDALIAGSKSSNMVAMMLNKRLDS